MAFTFDGFEPANTTPVPDILFDVLLPELSESELKVLLYIIRRTSGFKKTEDAISLSQFQNGITKRSGEVLDGGCGIKNRTTLSKALASLEAKGCITSEKRDDPQGDKATTVYKVRFQSDGVVRKTYHGSTQNVLPVVTDAYHGSTQDALGVVRKTYPQETVIQETDLQLDSIQEGTIATSAEVRNAPASDKIIDWKTASGKMRAMPKGQVNDTPSTPVPPDVSSGLDSGPGDGLPTRLSEHTPDAGTHSLAVNPPVDGQDDGTSDQAVSSAVSQAQAALTVPGSSPPKDGVQPGALPKRPRTRKLDEPLIAPDVMAVIERWSQAMKKPYPMTDNLMKAATLLAPCDPSIDDLKAVRAFCFKSNPKWFRDERKGAVTLLDIAKNWEAWQSSQEAVTTPTKPGEASYGGYYILGEAM